MRTGTLVVIRGRITLEGGIVVIGVRPRNRGCSRIGVPTLRPKALYSKALHS